MKKRSILPSIILMCSILLFVCNNNGESMKIKYAHKTGENEQKEYVESTDGKADTDRKIEKGYDLPIDARQRKEVEEDCKEILELISEIYNNADKGGANNVVIADEVMEQMACV